MQQKQCAYVRSAAANIASAPNLPQQEKLPLIRWQQCACSA
jgi:hypothetical protein